ncbi:alpha-2,8-polysialyltransferase family protein [Azoarcus sp. PA01]|nr:alpha-2,8-polysialyltransferase family protein [Azoarcus sp. PA01]
MTKKLIFSVCHTPLHFLFTYVILRSAKANSTITIIWIKESDINPSYVRRIIQELGASLVCLKGAEGGSINRTLNRISNLRKLKSIDTLKEATELYIFNDLSPEVQLIVRLTKKNNPSVNLVEDGVAIYDIGGYFNTNFFKILLGKLFYGPWWRKSNRIGGVRLHNAIYAINPALVRKEISNGVEIKKIKFCVNSFSTFCDSDHIKANSIVFLLPFIGYENSEVKIINRIKSSLREFKGNVYLKLHPQDKPMVAKKILSMLDSFECHILRSDMPAEIYFISSQSERTVVGFKTSALHVLRSFCPSVKAKYFGVGLEDNWIRFYKEMNVEEYKTN